VRFSAPIQTGPGAYPASYTMGTGSFLGVKRPGCGTDHPPSSSTEVKDRVQPYLYSLWAFVASSRLNFTFLLFKSKVQQSHYKPGQALGDSRRLRLPDFKTIGT